MDEMVPTDAAASGTTGPQAPAPSQSTAERLSRDPRFLALATPLGENAVQLREVRGEEAISRLFHFELDLEFGDSSVTAESLLGKGVTIRIKIGSDQGRFLNGLICRIAQAPSETRPNLHRADLVPSMWLLTRSTDCRTFQGLSVPGIVSKVLTERGLTDFELRLQRPYPALEYCVQYRETDFNFISRLLEDEGIWYFFEHTHAMHRLVLADSTAEYRPCPVQPQAKFSRSAGKGGGAPDAVTGWAIAHELRPSRYSTGAFNFETPSTNLGVSIDSVKPSPVGSRPEVYDFPGRFKTRADGETIVRTRIEEEESQELIIRGAGSCRPFTAGYRFELLDQPGSNRDGDNRAYVLVAMRLQAFEPTYRSGSDEEQRPSYSNTFTCLPATVPFRPRRTTPRPVISGVQSAIVVGKAGEELWVDKHGRVKVQFHWDRQGKRDDNSSCWVRVAQNWAGKRWGTMFLPRVGQEVLVEFLDGDPDSPVVTGRLYNGENAPPYELPTDQTKSSIKSASSKGGGGSNELRFEDKKGSEQIFIQGERDLDFIVKRDAREWIGASRHLIVTANRLEQVKQDNHLKVGGNSVSEVAGAQSLSVAKDLYIKSGTHLVLETGGSITLKGAGGFVQIDSAGVTIQGTLVNINSGGTAVAGAALALRLPDQASSSGAAGGTEAPTEPPTVEKDKYALVVAHYEGLMKEHGDKMTPEDKAAADAALEELKAAAAKGDDAALLVASQKLHKVLEKTAGKPLPPAPGFKAAGVDNEGHTILAPEGKTKDGEETDGPASPTRLVGPLKIVNGDFVDSTGPVVPVFCHFMEAFSAWTHGRQADVKKQCQTIAAAGYQGIRVLDVLGYYDVDGGGRPAGWHGKAVTPITFTSISGKQVTATPNFYDQKRSFLQMLNGLGLKIMDDRGDLNDWRDSQKIEHMRLNGELYKSMGDAGRDVLAGLWACNESWQNGVKTPELAGRMLTAFKEGAGWWPDVRGLSWGAEENDWTSRPGAGEWPQDMIFWSKDPASICTMHGNRIPNEHIIAHYLGYGYYDDDMRRRGKRTWNTEPVGGGIGVSVGTVNDAELLAGIALVSMLTGQAWTHMSGYGVFWDGPIEKHPGFYEIPRILKWLPRDVHKFAQIGHCGRRFQGTRILADTEPPSGTRADFAIHRDGRFVMCVYGEPGKHPPLVFERGCTECKVIDIVGDKIQSEGPRKAGERFTETYKHCRMVIGKVG